LKGVIFMKIVALNGLLGYGYSEESLHAAFNERVDFLGVDAGSTDPGPYYLGSGKSFTDRGAVKRDLALALPLALEHKAPFIIGTAGGAGSSAHVEWLREILLEIASHAKNGAFSTFKISSYPGNYLNRGQCIFAIDSSAGATWMGSDAPLMDIHQTETVQFETVVYLWNDEESFEAFCLEYADVIKTTGKDGDALATQIYLEGVQGEGCGAILEYHNGEMTAWDTFGDKKGKIYDLLISQWEE
jgi:hypothetical protein